MSGDINSFNNRGEYFSAHYFAEQLDPDLKRGLFSTWADREGDQLDSRPTAREQVRALRAVYLAEDVRSYFAGADREDADRTEPLRTYQNPDWCKRLTEWHQQVLRALGFTDGAPGEITVHRAGREHHVQVAYSGAGIVALDCGWAPDNDSALAADGPGRLLTPLRVSASENYETGSALASWLFHSALDTAEGAPPRFVLLLMGGVIVLADRNTWGEGRYLSASLDTALERNDRRQGGELAQLAALFSADMLRPGDNGQGPLIDTLLKASSDNAVGVSGELRHGLQRSVEVIANEVLGRLYAGGLTVADVEDGGEPFAKQLTRESLRYLYRILFLLYAEARPELGILPADDGSYEAGYSMARLRELVERDEQLAEEATQNGFHLYESLDVLFSKVNFGHRPYGSEPDDDQPGDDEEARAVKAARRSEDRGLRFEPLRSELFEPKSIRLIGRGVIDPRTDDDEPGWLDLRLRNVALHEVLRLLTMKKAGRKGERGGFISYRNLGINQLGAVYEGLMSYTGFIADKPLNEVAKGGDPKDGSWMIPVDQADQYPDTVFVQYGEDDARRGLRGRKRYEAGSFVYRLAGRDRQTSASYYTPESLTKVTVELTLQHRLDQTRDSEGNVIRTRAAELLKYKICEPALGSGAFLNEAINQVAAEYLKRRQEELGRSIPTSDALTELQKAKAYVALHNAYGVDLNATGVELAEVSLWLNTMHPGMRAPWFGLHLRRGNSLIGGRRAVYSAEDAGGKEWAKAKGTLTPTELPFLDADGERQVLPDGAVHQFLLPATGWGAVAGEKEAKALAPVAAKQLADWKKGILKPPAVKAPRGQLSQLARLQAVARRAEFLWGLVVRRMEISEREISRQIAVWGAGTDDPEYAFLARPETVVDKEKVYADLFESVGTPYWRLKTVMDVWCALWFWPLEAAGQLDGSELVPESETHAELGMGSPLGLPVVVGTERVPEPATPALSAPLVYERASLFDTEEDQPETVTVTQRRAPTAGRPKPSATRRSSIPLRDFADWLDFAEAVLGTVDVPVGTIADSFDSLEAIERYEDELPEWMGMDSENRLKERFGWLDTAEDIAKEQGFLHWELDFGLVFARGGGFDLQVGNPPWVQPNWNETLEFAEFDPWFGISTSLPLTEREAHRSITLSSPPSKSAIRARLSNYSGIHGFLTAMANYPDIDSDQTDLYLGFMCRTWANSHHMGISGLVHSESHLTSVELKSIRSASLARLRFHCHFINGGKWAFPDPVGHTTQFGAHIYGAPRAIKFLQLGNLYHSSVVMGSLQHDGFGEIPGTKTGGGFDLRPHARRVIQVDEARLLKWQSISGQTGEPINQTVIFTPVTDIEELAMDSLGNFPLRLGKINLVSTGFNETTAQNQRNIQKGFTQASSWDEVILSGPHISPGTPITKQAPDLSSHGKPVDLTQLPSEFIPATNFSRLSSPDEYRKAQKTWNGVPYSSYGRISWRKMMTFDMERCFNVALIPPGPTHVDGLYSMSRGDSFLDALTAGFWSSIPIEYMVRLIGKKNLHEQDIRRLPIPIREHPLSQALAIRSLRMNCLTSAYSDFWNSILRPASSENEDWANDWPGLPSLAVNSSNWTTDVPLRSDFARRAALVEIDALVATWIGMDIDSLCSIYRDRFPLLREREERMWFDIQGRRIAGDSRVFGHGQTRLHYENLQIHLSDPTVPPPDGYTAPFYKADREAEMRAAHAVFQARLDAAIASGEWTPPAAATPATVTP
ncbi:hypothetical protein ABIA32_000301 [Streptacidiphilus sp. MAP12-20]|uniref:hypothetical protein n=1 Tax=Streptacidiphilus sp. MAP12-20 TaxID=3156299 RepID=UPI00351175B6